MKYENPPFGRGETFYNGATIDTANLQGAELEGQEYEFPDLDYSAFGQKTKRSEGMVRVRVVRNVSGAALLPKRLGRPYASGVNLIGQIDGYTRLTAEKGLPIDEFLPAAGVPNNDLFYVVVKGPAVVLAPLAGSDYNGDVAVGQNLVALTAVTAGATTAGRVAAQNITGLTTTSDYTFLVNQIQNRLGHALSAKTTANTNADILINVTPQW